MTSVKGMDRPPTDAIDGIVKYIAEYSEETFSNFEEVDSNYPFRRNLSVTLGCIIIAFLVAGYLSVMILRGVIHTAWE